MEQDRFYKSKRWVQKRAHILRRDGWIDQVALRDGVKIEADTVHHILPREEYPQYQWCDWNLTSVNHETHKRLHEKYTGKLSRLGRWLMQETAQRNGVKVKMLTLVCGMPGTGKSTYVKEHLQGGLVYELDAIACAFRLTIPHKEPTHSGARRMAAALRSGWLQAARQYADNLFVVRTAPGDAELAETMPDKIVICTQQHIKRPYEFSKEEYQRQLDNVIAWADANEVPVEYYPPHS